MGPFTRYDPSDIRDLVAEYPLAWVSATNGRADEATQLPLLGEYDSNGALTHLLGHIPRRHRLVETLGAGGQVTILFQGPQGYISPEHAGLRDWAPTWNFAQLSIAAELTFLPGETGMAVAALVETMERGRADPWDAGEMGERYAMLETMIVAFRARVIDAVGRFKLGQDERPEVRAAIIRALGDTPLARWMRRFDRNAVSD